MGKPGEIRRSRKHSRMAGNSTQNAGILILYLTLDNSMAKSAVVGSRRNQPTNFLWRIEGRIRHAERSQHFPLAKAIQRFIGKAFQRNPENDESNIAVFGVKPGIGLQWHRKGSMKQLVSPPSPQK